MVKDRNGGMEAREKGKRRKENKMRESKAQKGGIVWKSGKKE